MDAKGLGKRKMQLRGGTMCKENFLAYNVFWLCDGRAYNY